MTKMQVSLAYDLINPRVLKTIKLLVINLLFLKPTPFADHIVNTKIKKYEGVIKMKSNKRVCYPQFDWAKGTINIRAE